MELWDGPPDEEFDAEFASGFIGKYLLVGVTRLNNSGELLSQEQLHGVIADITANGIDLELKGIHEGETWRMPPFLEELSPASPGIYSLRSTGEVIENPDFTFTLSIRKPAQQ